MSNRTLNSFKGGTANAIYDKNTFTLYRLSIKDPPFGRMVCNNRRLYKQIHANPDFGLADLPNIKILLNILLDILTK